MPQLPSASIAMANMPPSTVPVWYATRFIALSAPLWTNTYPMPLGRTLPRPPLRAYPLILLYRLSRLGMALISYLHGNQLSPRQSNWYAVLLPNPPSLPPSLAGICWVLVAHSSGLIPVPTGVSLHQPTTILNFNVSKPSPNTVSSTFTFLPIPWLFNSFHCSA